MGSESNARATGILSQPGSMNGRRLTSNDKKGRLDARPRVVGEFLGAPSLTDGLNRDDIVQLVIRSPGLIR